MAADIRKAGRRLLLAVDVISALSAATVVTAVYLWPGLAGTHDAETGMLSIRLGGGAAMLFWAAFVLLVLHVLYYLYGRPPRAPLDYVLSEEPGGPVRIAREAIETGLHKAGEAVAGISRVRVAILPAGIKRLRVRTIFQAPDGIDLTRVTKDLRNALEQRFAALVRLGEGWRVEFELLFSGFAGKLLRKPGAEPEPQPEEAPFTGPKYPIDDDDDAFPRDLAGGRR